MISQEDIDEIISCIDVAVDESYLSDTKAEQLKSELANMKRCELCKKEKPIRCLCFDCARESTL